MLNPNKITKEVTFDGKKSIFVSISKDITKIDYGKALFNYITIHKLIKLKTSYLKEVRYKQETLNLIRLFYLILPIEAYYDIRYNHEQELLSDLYKLFFKMTADMYEELFKAATLPDIENILITLYHKEIETCLKKSKQLN